MFNFFKKSSAVSKWFMSKNESDYSYFIQLVEKVKKAKIPEYSFSEDKGSLVLNDSAGNVSKRINLYNIAVNCLQQDKREWEVLIKRFFDSLDQPSLNDNEKLDEVSALIAVQMYPKDILNQTKISFIYKEIIPETITVLVFDAPERIEFVKQETINKWNKTVDELFILAINNTKRILKDLPFPEIGNGSKVQVGESENVLTACASLFLKDANNSFDDNGMIFSIPNRHIIITLPVNNLESITKDLPFMAYVTQQANADGAYPINTNLYWVKDDRHMKLPYEFKDKNFNFFPPEEFIDTLNGLV